MEVVATRRGFYDGLIREPGDKFDVGSQKELGSWMEPVRKPRKKTVVKGVKRAENISTEQIS